MTGFIHLTNNMWWGIGILAFITIGYIAYKLQLDLAKRNEDYYGNVEGEDEGLHDKNNEPI